MRHNLLHYTSNRDDWGAFPTIVSGDGCIVVDRDGREYIDGLAGLFTTQVGHGRGELVDAAAAQMSELAFFPNWSLHHPAVLNLSARLRELAPGDLDATFFVCSGSEAVEAMLKIVRQYHAAQGHPLRHKIVTRRGAYHGTTMGALAMTGLPSIKASVEPLPGGFLHAPNTQHESAADLLIELLEHEGPENVAAVVLEPVQNGGGCLVPPEGYWARIRDFCDQHGILLVADSVICAFGRLGTWFGIERFGVEPDLVTFAKGLTSGYVPMGGVLLSERVRAGLQREDMLLHGATFGGHPVAAAVALESTRIIERERLLERVLEAESHFEAEMRRVARAHDIAKDARGMGYFWAIEIDPRRGDGRPLDAAERDRHLRDELYHTLVGMGLLCRFDDRDSPVIQVAPPLVADRALISRIAEILDRALGSLEESLGYR